MKTIAVWFSCGAPSAVAAKLALKLYPDFKVRILNNFIKEEHDDNRRFLKEVQEWLGVEIEQVVHPKYPSGSAEEVWKKRRYMSGVAGAPCTMILKREARQIWERENKIDHHVFGFTLEEKDRHDRFVAGERSNVLPILIDEKVSRQDAAEIINLAGIELPFIYKLLPNANCIGCVKSASPTYWNIIRKHFPETFKRRSELSREIGAKLVKISGERRFLDELTEEDKGRPLNLLKMPECGLFCEEWSEDWV